MAVLRLSFWTLDNLGGLFGSLSTKLSFKTLFPCSPIYVLALQRVPSLYVYSAISVLFVGDTMLIDGVHEPR